VAADVPAVLQLNSTVDTAIAKNILFIFIDFCFTIGLVQQ
jgi:hypothetical protein